MVAGALDHQRSRMQCRVLDFFKGVQTMVELTPRPDEFRGRIREFYRKETGCRLIKVAKGSHIYTTSQRDGMVYFIESGRVKLVLDSPEGKECLLAIRTPGDIFGELCLSGQITRLETAMAMQETTFRQMPHTRFLIALKQESLLEGLVQYLAVCVADQQEIITAMATADGAHRLARTLLYLSRILGSRDPRGACIDQLTHQDLSEMVGTTRPRVGIFLKKFRELGLVRLTDQRYLVIDESQMEEYVACNALPRLGGRLVREGPADTNLSGLPGAASDGTSSG